MPNPKKKIENKPWIAKGILKSISIKNKFFRNMCITKDMTKKEDIEKRVRHYKTNITKLMNQSKAKHFHNFFSENNLNFLKT